MLERRALTRNTIIQTLGKILSVILGWGTVLAMTNYLGAAGFGSYTIMTAYLQFFGVAADLGLVLVSSQLFAERANEKERIFANLLGFRLVTSAAILMAAPLVIWLFPYSTTVKAGVVILTLSFLFVALLQVFTGFFQQALTMWRSVAGELLGRTTLLGFVLFAVTQERGILFIVIGVTVGSLLNLALAALLSHNVVKVRIAFEPEYWKLIWHRSWPIALGVVFNLVYLKADTLILSFVRSETEVGVYGAMYRVLEVLVTFPTMFAGLLLPILTTAWANKRYEDFRRTVAESFTAIVSIALPLAVGLAITAPKVVALFGSDFTAQGGDVLRLLGVATAIIFVGTFFGHIIVAINEQRSVLWAYALAAAFSLVAYLVVIPVAGAIGAAAVTVAVELLIAVLLYYYLRRRINSFFTLAPLLPSLLATIVMALFLWLAINFSVILTIPLAVVIYAAVLLAIDPTPRKLLIEIFSKAENN
ncbi:MAG: oligosaccharide flippase family protein [Patescibacteria group bacterium]|jgi:O-antigen/teichoic acid export membrane protein